MAASHLPHTDPTAISFRAKHRNLDDATKKPVVNVEASDDDGKTWRAEISASSIMVNYQGATIDYVRGYGDVLSYTLEIKGNWPPDWRLRFDGEPVPVFSAETFTDGNGMPATRIIARPHTRSATSGGVAMGADVTTENPGPPTHGRLPSVKL